MSDNIEDDINFHSGDIKKKDLDFNVREKSSDKFAASFGGFKQKLSESPLFRGKNKFITLGVAVVVIALAIALPMLLPRLLAPPAPTELTPEEQEEEQQIKEDVADTVNNVDPNSSDDTKDTILSDLDARISAASNVDDKSYYIKAKANALQRYGRYDEAIEILKPLIDELRAAKRWTPLQETYGNISGIYSAKGDKTSAIEWMKGAIGVIDEAASDPESPTTIAGREFYTNMLARLENS